MQYDKLKKIRDEMFQDAGSVVKHMWFCQNVNIKSPDKIHYIKQIKEMEAIFPDDVARPGTDIALSGVFVIYDHRSLVEEWVLHGNSKRQCLLVDMERAIFTTTEGSYVKIKNGRQVCEIIRTKLNEVIGT